MCQSKYYKRDEGYYSCELEHGHNGEHQHTYVTTWSDEE